MDGGEQLGRCLSFLDSGGGGGGEEEEEKEEDNDVVTNLSL
jgi:hypothetical protein